MIVYPKIETLFVRDEQTHKVVKGSWRMPEFEYLKDNPWLATEKVDGTNIRVMYLKWVDAVKFGGRTDNAQLNAQLIARLQELFTPEKFAKAFDDDAEVCLYGEGYGPGIQKGGGRYIDHKDFILFDVRVGDWWLRWPDVEDVAEKLGIQHVPVIGRMSLADIVPIVESGFTSTFGGFIAEGVVVRPMADLLTRRGHRLLGKLKGEDF